MSPLPKHVIDVHTHVFNARYLPLKGITRPHLGSFLAGTLATIINGITKSSFRETKEADRAVQPYLKALKAARQPVDYAEALWVLIEGQINTRAVRQMNMFSSVKSAPLKRLTVKELEGDPFMKALGDLSGHFKAKHPDKARLMGISLYPNIVGAMQKGLPISGALAGLKINITGALRDIAAKLQKANAFGDSAHDYLEFLYTLTRDENSMLEKVKHEYRSDQPMRLFVHYMMDMKYGCEKPDNPYYAFFPQQCEYMLQLAASSGGTLIGFSAFDPRRENWREIADKSLRMGFVGFKFYPSMGFLPIGNKDKVVEKRVEEFLLYCIERKVPIVAHCTPKGFQAVKGSGINAHPKHWARRLATKGFKDLRLNLCHAGGGDQPNAGIHSMGWYAVDGVQWNDPDNFARIVSELCTAYPNVYCDLSYMLELMAPASAPASVRPHFEQNFLKALDTKNFSQKVMFGSDWNMPEIIDETDDYLDYYSKTLFAKPDFSPYRDRFFWKNALEFLDLATYFTRLDAIADRPEVIAYAKGLRAKYKTLVASWRPPGRMHTPTPPVKSLGIISRS